jgi:hypothetical protein
LHNALDSLLVYPSPLLTPSFLPPPPPPPPSPLLSFHLRPVGG